MLQPWIQPTPGAETLNDLIRRVADRDQAAFGRLYQLLVRIVFAQLRDLLGGAGPAVPVTRAVFVEVWRLAPVFDPHRDDVLTWVTMIATRRAADRFRALQHRPPATDPGYDRHLRHELAAALQTGAPAGRDPLWAVPSGACRHHRSGCPLSSTAPGSTSPTPGNC